MFTLAQHRATCVNPTPTMDALIKDEGNCVGVVRRSWGIPSLGASALIAFRAVPSRQMHYTSPLDVPEGAICYGLNGKYGQPLTRYGHAWIATTSLLAWTTDYVEMGTWKKAPMSLPRWTGGDTKVQWTRWTPYGLLPVGKTQRERNAAVVPKPPVVVQPSVNLRNLRYGARNDDVKDLQRALNRHLGGVDLPVTGFYGTLTDAAVRRDQAAHLPPADPARRSFVGVRQAVHLGLKVIG
jgi:hypothetical protein